MLRLTLSQLLIGTTLIAIVLVFTQTEGCGRRFTMIESLSFSSDDSRIVVTKLNARNALTPMKLYKANVSRTVSWLDASNGNSDGLLHQDFKSGNCGPAFHLWRVGRTSALCNPSNNQVAMSAFGGGDITRNVGTARANVTTLQHPAYNIAYSNSGRFLAASGMDELTVLDTENDIVAMRVQSNDLPFLDASLMSFTNDDMCVILAGHSGVNIWNIATATKRSTVIKGFESWINFIVAAPNNSLVVCSDDWVRRYDFDGNVVATFDDRGANLCSISADGMRLAISGYGGLAIYDLSSNRLLRSLSFQGVTALALSCSGDELVVGDNNGRVTLIDTRTGARQWTSSPHGRYRWPWTLPGAFLVAWIYVVWRLFRRQKIVDTHHLEALPEQETVR